MSTPGSNKDESLLSTPTSDPEPEVTLGHLDPNQRAQFLKQLFSKRVEPLAYVAVPDECNEWPDLRKEIVAAYLRYTTFTVKVWTNYDAAMKKFYLDDRLQNCGELVLSPSENAHLDRVDPNGTMQFNRIRLEIGTAFTNLCEVKLYALPSTDGDGIDIQMRVGRVNTEHPRAVDFVHNTCNWFNNGGCETTNDQRGMIFADIEDIAALFCRKPTQTMMDRLKFSPNTGPFMIDDSENPAWVDFEALDKECYFGCHGCSGSKYTRYSLGNSRSRYW